MMLYTKDEKLNVVAFSITFESFAKAQQHFEEKFKKKAPSRSLIKYWQQKLLNSNVLETRSPNQSLRVDAMGDEFKELVAAEIEADPSTSVRAVASTLNTSKSSVHRALRSEAFKPYKPTSVQQLTDDDFDRRIEFCDIVLNRSPSFFKREC